MPKVTGWSQINPTLFKGQLDAPNPSKFTFTYKGKRLPIDPNLLSKLAAGQPVAEGASLLTSEGGIPYVYIHTQHTEPVDLSVWNVTEDVPLIGGASGLFAGNNAVMQ